MSCVVGGMLSVRVGSMHAHMHYVCVKSCPECSVHMLFLCRKVWERACVKWPVRKTDVHKTQGWMVTPIRKCKYEEVRWSLSRSSLTVRCAGVSAFRFPIVGVLSLVAITTTHCTVHERGMAAAHVSVGMCNIPVSREWDEHGQSVDQSVGQSVGARGPVDHDSVGRAWSTM